MNRLRPSMKPLAATRRIPRTVWILGLASLFMDLSSEAIHALLPVFLVSVLGTGAAALGVIEGVAEATASIAKVFSGVWSDRVGRRKPLVVLGYGLAALAKPLFPLAGSAAWVLVARFVDRLGKGIRGAPRDALVADVTPPAKRGAAYGLRQALDTAGALLAPLAAIALMAALADDIRGVFWVAMLPAWVAVGLLVFGIAEPAERAASVSKSALPQRHELRQLGAAYWSVVAVGAVFTLARFSEAFLVLRAHDVGLALVWTPLALAVMNVTYVATAYPAGTLSDAIGRWGLLAAGVAVLIAADAVLAVSSSLVGVFIGIALWGLHMGLTQGLLSAMVADAAPGDLRGAAFGLFHFVTGVAALAASLVAGVLWQWTGPRGTFVAGAAFSAVALAGLALGRRRFAARR